jgi:4-amino-4-deoxy-L-arabinose transferase-like glycosyltransferase
MAEILVSSYSINNRSLDHAGADAGVVRLRMLLIANALVWTISAWLFRSNLDWAGDMLENYVWGIEWQMGYFKHPPLFAWMAGAWFSVFPRTNLAYFALSNVNALIGLCGIVALARRFVPAREAAVAGLAMAVSPIYTTLAIKFNANTVLLSLWPWTAYFFVCYVQDGTRKTAMAFGAAAALAMLGKYFSVTLLAGLLMAGLARPAWRARLLRPESLLAIMAGTIVLWPHLRWLADSGMPTFAYARERMLEIEHPLPLVLKELGVYALVQVAYLLPSMAFLLLLARHGRGRAIKLMLYAYVQRSLNRDLWWLSMGTLMAICVLSLATGTSLSALWGDTQWFALGTFWLAILANAGIGINTGRIYGIMAAYWILVLAASAAGGYLTAAHQSKKTVEPRAELALKAREIWRERTSLPLTIVAGDDKEARSIAFYGRNLTRYWELADPAATPWLSSGQVRREGALLVCREDNADCRKLAAAFSGVQPELISVHKKTWGFSLPERRYALYVMPPLAQEAP